jgi:hypothetical protein
MGNFYRMNRKFLLRLLNAAFRLIQMTISSNLTKIIWTIDILLMTLPILIVKVSRLPFFNKSYVNYVLCMNVF